MTAEAGLVVWITGLSAVGKTTLGNRLIEDLRRLELDPIFLDGDNLREIFDLTGENSHSFEREYRLSLAMRYSKLCKLLSEQGLLVVIATISMFSEVYKWNRINLSNYLEVHMRAPIEELKRRDPKGLYKRFDEGSLHNLAGLDLEVDEPSDADLVLDFGSGKSVKQF